MAAHDAERPGASMRRRRGAASRIEGGTAFRAARVAMMIVGSVISDSTMPPTSGAERGRPKKPRNTARPSKPEHDGRHSREVVDVDLDQVGQPVRRREFLQINRRGDAHGEGNQETDEQRIERADNSTGQTGLLRKATVRVHEQLPVERRADQSPVSSELKALT